MKRILQLCILLMLVLSVSSFTSFPKQYGMKVNDLTGDETIAVSGSPGLGAKEVIIYVNRSGNEAGVGNVSFDVDLMFDYNPQQVQTFHVYVPAGYIDWYLLYQTNWVVGTDVTVVGSIYNVTYY